MKIIFNPAMSETRNLLDSLYMLYNNNYKKDLDTFSLKPNRAVEEALEYLSDKVSFKLRHKELFFKEDISTLPALVSFEDLEQCNTGADFIQLLNEANDETIKLRVLKALTNDKSIEEEEIKAILLDNTKTIQFIRELELSSSIKWEVFDFFQDIRSSMVELVEFLLGYYPLCRGILDKNKTLIEQFDSYLINGVQTEGAAFIKKITRGAIDFEGIDKVFAASAFFNSHSLSFSGKENKLHLYIGTTFEEAAKGIFGEEQVEINLNIIKNLSDKTRFQILMLLKDKELYGQEIADKIGITMATVSYHMSYLLISNLVSIDKVGHKGFYKLNKDTLRSNIDFLTGIFEL